MTEKKNESFLHIISIFSFCNTFSFFLAFLFFASSSKESTNKKSTKMHFAHPKILTKINLAPPLCLAWSPSSTIYCSYFLKLIWSLIVMWSIAKSRNSLFPSLTLYPLVLSFSLSISLSFCPLSGTIHTLVTVGHVQKQVLFMVFLEHSKAENDA